MRRFFWDGNKSLRVRKKNGHLQILLVLVVSLLVPETCFDVCLFKLLVPFFWCSEWSKPAYSLYSSARILPVCTIDQTFWQEWNEKEWKINSS